MVVLQLVTGIYLLAQGIAELVFYRSDLNQFARSVSRAFGGSGDILSLIVALIAIAAGALLIWVLFGAVSGRLLYLSTMIIAVLWVLRSLAAYVFNAPFEPTFIVWLANVSGDLIPGIVVWLVGRQYA